MRKIFVGGIAFISIVVIGLIALLVLSFWPSAKAKPLPKVDKIQSVNIPLAKYDKSTTKYARDFVVSDIHGRFDSFKAALKTVNFSKSDRLFVLGDTIDRGPEGFHALLYLTHTLPSEGYHVVVLTGNHEDMWFEMASKGTTDKERQSNLNGQIDIYEGDAPNGWEASIKEWNALTANERAYLLNEMGTGFGEPRMLVMQIDGKWVSFSHSTNFTKTIETETVNDLSWYNQMKDSDDTFNKSVAAKLGVPESDVQAFIGHIGGLRFGVHPHYICLDDTNTRDFSKSPGVPLYEIENGKFYKG